MRIKTSFPRTIRVIEHVWIPMSDGTRLAATIWLPQDAEQNPVPALLEYVPYRKNDGTALRDSTRHPYFAGHGYASVRVDIRGSGDSEGILYDEYLPQEQLDAVEVIAWLAAQLWCTGAVGMMGISWGGFNSLQVAARRPPALKAILTLCSTDDRYADDVHYMGGCVLGTDMLSWASIMFAYNARPPDPTVVGERWREMWFERMEKTPPFIEAWLTHQRRDAYWKQGSVCEDFARIQCAVYAVGGWADPYRNAIPRLLAGLRCPKKGLIGPWSHAWPDTGQPGPSIGFLQEALRWWDYWLKGVDTGVMAEPEVRTWMQASEAPKPYYAEWPGRWVAEPAWPPPNTQPATFFMNEGCLDSAPAPEARLAFAGSLAHGLDGGVWCPYGLEGDLPPDQRAEDGLALCFDSAPLPERMEVLGFPEVTLAIEVDKPLAVLAVRLCDVAPTGASTRVSWGLLNLTHRDSHEHPTALEPGQRYTVTVRLSVIGHAIAAGHRWRVAISPAYWPSAWPSPEPVTLSVFTGAGSTLTLPVRPPRAEDSMLAPFAEPENSAALAHAGHVRRGRNRYVRRDVAKGHLQLVEELDGGDIHYTGSGRDYLYRYTDTFNIVEGDPLSASVRCDRTCGIGRGDWQTRVETSSAMTAEATHFRVTNRLDAYEGHTRVFSKSWNFSVPRDLV